jgi:flagellar M-ring protein FliF
MDQLKKLLGALTLGQKVGTLIIFLAVAGGISGFVQWRHESGFKPLYSGMSPDDAAAVVQKLKEGAIEHRIADGGTAILIPESKIDEVRIELAGAGLPKTGRIGFELFDKTNIGITDFTERINYRRALEGELERSIRGISSIAQARVHITFARDSVFVDSREPAKASVLVSVRPGAWLSPLNVAAVTNLVASAVEGLSPEFVSVVDMQGNLLNRPRKPGANDAELSDALLDYRHQVEKDLTAKVESTLQPLLGDGKFRVGITADCDFTTTEQTDEVFDPSKSVMVSSQKTEDTANNNQSAGVPGTPSNLPRPANRPALTGNSVARRTESVAYETTRTVRAVKTPRGVVKRLSAALLLDEPATWIGKGSAAKRVSKPLPPEEVKAIRDVVAGVLGIDAQRGDQLVVENLPFEPVADSEPGVPATFPAASDPATNWMKKNRIPLIGGGAGLLVVLAGGAFWMLRRPKGSAQPAVSVQPQLPQGAEKAKDAPGPAIEGTVPEAALKLPPATSKVEDLRQKVRENVSRDPAMAASVIRGWLDAES